MQRTDSNSTRGRKLWKSRRNKPQACVSCLLTTKCGSLGTQTEYIQPASRCHSMITDGSDAVLGVNGDSRQDYRLAESVNLKDLFPEVSSRPSRCWLINVVIYSNVSIPWSESSTASMAVSPLHRFCQPSDEAGYVYACTFTCVQCLDVERFLEA